MTREAIDERLRVIEEVQQSLFRAAEELRRVRDLPTQPVGAIGVDVKGKGKAVFDIAEATTPTDMIMNVGEREERDSDSDLGVRSVTDGESLSFDVSPTEN